jgi:hypothetical protein
MLREYGEYLETLDRPLDVRALLVDEGLSRSTLLGAGLDDVDGDFDAQEPGGKATGAGARRWLIGAAAAVAAAALVITLAVVATGSGDNQIRTRPATQNSTPSTTGTPVTTTPGDGSTDSPLLPEGAQSTQPTGEVVAVIGIRHRGVYRLHADGRLLFTFFGGEDLPPGLLFTLFGDEHFRPAGWWPWAEQRLTPEGVERVRSRFLSSGLFDTAPPLTDLTECPAGVTASVRDGDHWLCVAVDNTFLPQSTAPPEADRLFDDLMALDSTIPATEWADQQVKPYVPTRVATCLRTFVSDPSPNPYEALELPVVDLSVLLARFPAPVAQLLAGRERSDLTSRVPREKVGQGVCFELTLDEARALADASLGPAGGGTHQYWGLAIPLARQPDPAQPDSARADLAYIFFEPLLPDSEPTSVGD